MKRTEDLFTLHRAKSDIFSRYRAGDVPYIGNGLSDNAVIGLVEPLSKDKVFGFTGIAISAFCEASVQVPPFVACGRAGNGIVVLEPRTSMTSGQLAYYAAYINAAVRWRFSWYWQTTGDRLKRILLPDAAPEHVEFRVGQALPTLSTPTPATDQMRFERFALGSIYHLKPGDYHSVGQLPPGPVPMVSCGDLDNGVCGYFDIDKHVYQNKMTIAFNGRTLAAKYHPYRFAAKDDVAVCTARNEMKLTTQLFIQVMLGREQWRFSYYRKCYVEKLKRVTVPLPVRSGQIDEQAIQDVMKTTQYWGFLKTRLEA